MLTVGFRSYLSSVPTLQNYKTKNDINFGNRSKLIQLSPGVKEAEPLVKQVITKLESLLKSNLLDQLAFYDLAKKCKEPDYQDFVHSVGILKKYGLVQENGKIHNSVKKIVNATAEVSGSNLKDGLTLKLVNPFE